MPSHHKKVSPRPHPVIPVQAETHVAPHHFPRHSGGQDLPNAVRARGLNLLDGGLMSGSAHGRDSNAAKNILAAPQAERLNACRVKSKSSLLVSDPEAGTRLDRGARWAS